MDDGDRARRWDLVLPHRDRLLRLARTLVADPGDAEACVQEALARCVTFPALDEANVAAFLVATTRRLCVDHHRGRARDTRLAGRLTGHAAAEPPPDDAVCDRAEAAWVSERLADLPHRQRAVACARAAGLSPQEIADRLAVSYKTVETLLYRVRVRARTELERAYGLVALLAVRRPRAAAAGMAAASVAVVTGSLLLAPPDAPAQGAVPPPAATTTFRAAAPAAPVAVPARAVRARAGSPPAPRPEPTPAPPPPAPASSPPRPKEPARCGAPPYLDDPCVSPDPSETPLVRLLDCVTYGIDWAVGFRCRSSPTPSPTGSRRTEGGDS